MTAIPKLGPVIAIDGPAGTGKSTTTKRLAEALGFVHVDTGALYRAIAYLLLEQGKQISEEDAAPIARSAHLEFRRIETKNPANRLFADGRDVTDHIRTPEVSMASSRVSAIPGVRAALLGLQRRLGCAGKTILEGRDIGTVVFPDADVKFFLTADVDERAQRRLKELQEAAKKSVNPIASKNVPSYDDIRRQIVARDDGDSSRAVAPLKKASDAIEIDTSRMTLDQVVQKMESVVRERLGKR